MGAPAYWFRECCIHSVYCVADSRYSGFDLNLYIPISRVDANMQRAHSRNAAAKGSSLGAIWLLWKKVMMDMVWNIILCFHEL
jgi:hypothetical protein